MKILITGGGGFLGTALAERLIDQNEVVLLDRDFDNNSFSYSKIKGQVRTKIVDILDLDRLKEAVKGYDIIIHTAAILGVEKVIGNVTRTLDVNFNGTYNLFKVSNSKIIVFSTSEVFGSNAVNVSEKSGSTVDNIQNPRWCYYVSKLASEYLASDYYRKGVPVVIIRPFNIFGDGRVGDYVMLRFILRALKNDNLEVYGNQIRAWCYVSDFCDAVIKCLDKKEAVGESFNIGNPANLITVYGLAELIVKLCRSGSKIVSRQVDYANVVARVPDITKAQRVLGYSPKVELEEGLNKTVKWVKCKLMN